MVGEEETEAIMILEGYTTKAFDKDNMQITKSLVGKRIIIATTIAHKRKGRRNEKDKCLIKMVKMI
jgi:hypothetical protein